jgi:hypothetical protein
VSAVTDRAARELLARPPAVTRILLDALNDSADGYRRTAASRRLAGPEFAKHREHYRVQEQACRELAALLRQPVPGHGLAATIAAWFTGGAR